MPHYRHVLMPALATAVLLVGACQKPAPQPEAAQPARQAPAAATPEAAPAPSEPIESRDVVAIRDEISLYTTEEALEAYAALLRSGRSDGCGAVMAPPWVTRCSGGA